MDGREMKAISKMSLSPSPSSPRPEPYKIFSGEGGGWKEEEETGEGEKEEETLVQFPRSGKRKYESDKKEDYVYSKGEKSGTIVL